MKKLLIMILSAILLIFVAYGVFFYFKTEDNNLTCEKQLADFYPLIINYYDFERKMPQRFNDILEPWGNNPEKLKKTFGCPKYTKTNSTNSPLGYILVPWKMKLGDIHENAPLVYDKTFRSHTNGVYVLTANGKVKFIDNKQYFVQFKKINPAVIVPSRK